MCDDPEGGDTCPEASDEVDCTCATKNNGVCNEPEGTDTCPEGSDAPDCP